MKPAKCFIAHKLSGWFYHTDGKRCASNEAVGRGTNDFIRIGTFEIISSHCYLFLWRFLGKVSRQMQLTMRNKFQETVYDEKKNHICSAINLFELQCRRLIKNCHVSVNLHRILFNLFVLIVNLNLYCSSEASEVRANRLYCMCLKSVNYGHCGFRARWSRINFDR